MSIHGIVFLFVAFSSICYSQQNSLHENAHAHNDYEHARPLLDALTYGFISVEADVHLVDGALLVSHGRPKKDARSLKQLYLAPLDSLLAIQEAVYPGFSGTFYLMIDCKTEAESTFRTIQKELEIYHRLRCTTSHCPVKIFISGNRAVNAIINESHGIGLDGRPDDLGKGISSVQMPVVSDNYSKWSNWNGKSEPHEKDLDRIRELAQRVHAEGKKLRLWAITDNERTWSALVDAGVDFINTDKLKELHEFLTRKGL